MWQYVYEHLFVTVQTQSHFIIRSLTSTIHVANSFLNSVKQKQPWVNSLTGITELYYTSLGQKTRVFWSTSNSTNKKLIIAIVIITRISSSDVSMIRRSVILLSCIPLLTNAWFHCFRPIYQNILVCPINFTDH